MVGSRGMVLIINPIYTFDSSGYLLGILQGSTKRSKCFTKVSEMSTTKEQVILAFSKDWEMKI